ncbi:copper resistance CopC family protein [Allosaccharopolyspora coralli]|nr:copper resistance CopC family protein [Allosaccharopolyspora coralli]
MTVAVLTLLGALLAQPHSWAHAELTGSDPVGGSALQQAPAAARLTFTDSVNPELVTLAVTDQDGGQPPLPAPAIEHNQVVQPLPNLGNGGYTIAYRVVSADGHPVAGQIPFTISASTPRSAPPPGTNPRPPAVEEQAGGAWLPWAGGGVVVVLLITGAVISVRRLGRDH